MNKRLFPRMAFYLTLITSFLFMPLSSVYADVNSQDSDFWHWWYVEETTKRISGNNQGVDVSNASSTDNGLTTGNYVYNNSGINEQDVINYVSEQYENATGYVVNSASNYADKVKNVWNKTIDATTAAAYQAEKALRTTVDETGKTVVDVSSSDYWNGIYNKWFNNRGYKDTYNNENNNNKVSGTSNRLNYSIAYYGLYPIQSYTLITDPVFTGNAYTNVTFGEEITSGRIQPVFICQADGIVYYKIGNGQVYYNYWFSGLTLNTNVNPYRIESHFAPNAASGEGQWVKANFVFKSNNTNGSNESQPVLQPYSVGFINYNGNNVPIYRDNTLNPPNFHINDNGTVTVDGTDYPIYVDPDNLTPDGWLDLLEYISNDDQRDLSENDPFGYPWNTQPDGSLLGGFFSNLIKDISSIFNGIVNAISNLIDKIIKAIKDIANIIIDALQQFWTLLIGDIDGYSELFETDVDNHFTMISDLYDLLLECMGVDA